MVRLISHNAFVHPCRRYPADTSVATSRPQRTPQSAGRKVEEGQWVCVRPGDTSEPFSNRISSVKLSLCSSWSLAPEVMVLSAVGIGRRIIRFKALALQSPQRARGGCPLRPDGFRRSSPHPRLGGQAHRIDVEAVRIRLTTSGECPVRAPAERFARAYPRRL